MSKISFNKDFYIYSTHKTSTQSLKSIFDTVHIHKLGNVQYTKDEFLENVQRYYKKNNKKIKILTTLRIPSQRVISSYFQLYHSREVGKFKKRSNQTTVMKNTIEHLVNDIKDFIQEKKYPTESLYEIMSIFDFNFNDIKVNKMKHYGFYENNWIELYILDFDSIIGKNRMKYLENIFRIKLMNKSANKSENKLYYEKYKKVKEIIGDKFDELVNSDHVDLISLKKEFY